LPLVSKAGVGRNHEQSEVPPLLETWLMILALIFPFVLSKDLVRIFVALQQAGSIGVAMQEEEEKETFTNIRMGGK
jgi:hypothetical protein